MEKFPFDQLGGFEPAASPVPSIVIAVGELARGAVPPICSIYLRGDLRRAAVTRFHYLGMGQEEAGALPSLIELARREKEVDPEHTARAVFSDFLRQSPAARAALDSLLHEVRTHENLLAAGWPASQPVPVNLLVISDLTDAQSIGMLMPLIALLHDICSADLLCQTFYLLNTGVFPSSGPDSLSEQHGCIPAILRDVRAMLDSRSAGWRKLAAAMGLSASAGLPPEIFLFDRRKEGSAEVKDLPGMATLMGNGLLALLEGNMARMLNAALPRDLDDGPIYHSIGAAAVIYDPEAAQASLACRAAAQFVETWLLAEPSAVQREQQERMLAQTTATLGGPADWLAALADVLPVGAGSAAMSHPLFSLRVRLDSLPFPALEYENLPATSWGAVLLAHTAALQDNLLPQAECALASEAARIVEAAVGQVGQARRAALRADCLYLGGLRAASQMLAGLKEHLRAGRAAVLLAAEQAQTSQAQSAGTHAAVADQLRATADSIRHLPRVFRWLPAQWRPKAAELYCLWKQRAQIQRLLDLRRQGVEVLEDQYGQALTCVALGHLLAISDALLAAVEAEAAVPVAWEQVAQAALTRISHAGTPDTPDHPEQNDLFRLRVGSPAWLEAVFQRLRPNYSGWLADLLAEEGLLPEASAADVTEPGAVVLAGWLQARGLEVFRDLWGYSVDRVLHEQGMVPARFSAGQFAAALPPLRPDFDVCGRAGARVFACLIGAPEWEACRLPDDAPQHWEARYTGNLYAALWIQSRGGIPAAAVEAGFASAEQPAWGGVDSWLVGGDDLTESLGPHAARQTHTYQWSFLPRGGKVAIPQQVRVQIDPQRVEHYRRQPRLDGQWNVYAEQDMPEVRELALAFHMLHARRRWSTFTQASNVLAFVQQCIPYRSDQDTTGYVDWPRYPIETLFDRAGDCEDVAILCAAVLARLGFQVILLVYERHVAFAVAGADQLKGDYLVNPITGSRCFYGEATAQGWRLGEVPKVYAGQTPLQVLPVTLLIDGPEGEGEDTGED